MRRVRVTGAGITIGARLMMPPVPAGADAVPLVQLDDALSGRCAVRRLNLPGGCAVASCAGQGWLTGVHAAGTLTRGAQEHSPREAHGQRRGRAPRSCGIRLLLVGLLAIGTLVASGCGDWGDKPHRAAAKSAAQGAGRSVNGKIAFSRYGARRYDVFVMSADGSRRVRLTRSAADESEPARLLGMKIAFTSTRAGNDDAVMNADGSHRKRLLRGGTLGELSWPRLSASASEEGRTATATGDTSPVAGGAMLRAQTSSAQNLTIRTRSGAVVALGRFAVGENPHLRAAIRAFGAPDRRVGMVRGLACHVSWIRLGLKVVFANFGGGGTACHGSHGKAQSASIVGSSGRRWRTERGLRLTHREAQIPLLHPNARKHQNGWWLAVTSLPFGDGCPCPYPSLRAKVTRGRVSSFRIYIGAAGD